MSRPWQEDVLDPAFLRRLDRLVLARRRSGPAGWSEHAGHAPRASGLEWVGHRSYQPGDDLRHLDWNVLARLDRPYVRQFSAERVRRLDLLIDRSRSMSLGQPPKADLACALGFVLGYVALSGGESVGAAAFADRLLARLPAGRGPRQGARLLEFLTGLPSGGGTELAGCIEEFAGRATEIGHVALLSDMLASDAQRALLALRARGFDVTLVRLRAAGDEDPATPDEELTVLDIETGERRDIRYDARVRERYRSLRLAEADDVRRFCSRSRIRLANLGTWQEIPAMVFGDLQRSGVLDGAGRR